MDELLVYPTTDVEPKRNKKAAINSKAVLITDSEILDKLKQEKAKKEAKAQENEAKALERKTKALEKSKKEDEVTGMRKTGKGCQDCANRY